MKTIVDRQERSSDGIANRDDQDRVRLVRRIEPSSNRLFPGWGPKLLLAAVAVFALANQATARAYTTSPAISMIPLSPATVAISNSRSACDADAAVDGTPFFEMPQIAADQGAHGASQVKIDLTSTGNLAHEELYASSGNVVLDGAAMRSARLTRFTPQVIACQRIAGSYLYVVDF
jgi:TonB family protein